MIDFHLDMKSGTPPYLQLVQQVHHALRLGILRTGDQLPTVRDVVARLAINPNTVLKAYRELEHEGLIAARPGQGTFVLATPAGAALADHDDLRDELIGWVRRAYAAGLTEDDVAALIANALHPGPRALREEGVA